MNEKKESLKENGNEKDCCLAEKMRQRLHQSYNVECPKCKSTTQNNIYKN